MASYALRRLFGSPGFTAATLLTLAIGIGANIAVFSVVNGILLKPLPYPEPDRLVGLWHTAPGINLNHVNVCPSLYFIYREQSRTFEKVGAYGGTSVTVTARGRPEEVRALSVTRDVLPILGAQPVLGHLFTERDDSPGTPRTVILTWGYWQSHFSGEASVIGKHLITDGNDREIVGVLPRDFRFIDPQPALVLPMRFDRNKAFLGNFSYQGIARLKPGATLAEANADMARMIPIWLRSFPPPPGFSVKVFEDARLAPRPQPFLRDVTGDVGNSLWVVMGTIGLVFFIACANVANLLLVRAEGRSHELSIRAALGAGWRRIASELLVESTLLALAGGVFGVALAYGALRLLVALAPPHLPRLGEIGIDPAAIIFALAISLFAGVLFGILPIVKYAGVHAGTGLRDSNRSVSAGRDRHRARNVLVVAQVALALVLLIASGLMIRTFQAMRSIEPGFTRPAEVLTVRVSIPEAEVKEPERVVRMDNEMLTKIAAIPGVQRAGLTSSNTMDGNNIGDLIFVEDQTIAEAKTPPVRGFKFVSPGFFATVGRRFVAGRDLTWADIYGYRPVAPLANVQTLDEIYGMSMARTSFTLVMLAISGGMALILGIVGIYGVISYSVSQRRREIGIRVALGARGREVSAMFVKHGVALATIGAACGLIAAAAMKKAIAAMLFGVAAVDPFTYAVMSMALIGAAVLASYIPARRAAAVNPVETLRAEA